MAIPLHYVVQLSYRITEKMYKVHFKVMELYLFQTNPCIFWSLCPSVNIAQVFRSIKCQCTKILDTVLKFINVIFLYHNNNLRQFIAEV